MTPWFVSQQKEMDKAKGQRDYEEKMIVSAWYNMVHGPTLRQLVSLALQMGRWSLSRSGPADMFVLSAVT